MKREKSRRGENFFGGANKNIRTHCDIERQQQSPRIQIISLVVVSKACRNVEQATREKKLFRIIIKWKQSAHPIYMSCFARQCRRMIRESKKETRMMMFDGAGYWPNPSRKWYSHQNKRKIELNACQWVPTEMELEMERKKRDQNNGIAHCRLSLEREHRERMEK